MQKSSFVDVFLVSKYASGFRNSHRCSVEKVVLKIFAIFTGKHWCWSLFLTKLQVISRIRTEYEYLSVLVSFRIQSKCGEKIEKKMWLRPFFMVATYFYYEKVSRTMRTTVVLYLFNIHACIQNQK